MAINRDAFIGNYLDETIENLQALEQGALRLKKDPDNEELLNSILRSLHTIKGSSRMLKFPGMESTAHAMENLFKGIKEQRYSLSPPIMQVLFIGCDLLKNGTQSIRSSKTDLPAHAPYLDIAERIYSNEPFDIESLKGGLPAAPDADPASNSGKGTGAGPDSQQAPADSALPKDTPLPAAAENSDYESIRVKLSQIETIMQSMNQIVIKQFQFKKIQEDLNQLESGLNETILALRKSGENSSHWREVQEISKTAAGIRKSFADQIAVIERNTYELQEKIMQLTMLPLNLIFGSIPRMVEEVSASLGKEVDCRISGSDILLDKAILEKLHDPIIHIVRNSLDHGLETAEERKNAGKNSEGLIRIDCSSEGGNIIIRIRDDGRGIDHQQVKQKALERQLISKEQLDEFSESEIYGLLFSPGFSTKQEVSDLSGRGVGLDIVRHNIQKVKGKISIHSSIGSGTEFILSLPLSLATVAGFFIKSGEQKFLIPSNFVHKIVRLPSSEKLVYYNREAFRLENSIIPLYTLSSLTKTNATPAGTHLYVVVVESLGEKIGIIVDAIIHHVQLIYKPLPRNIQRLKLVQGIVFDETYSIINILFVPELIKAFKSIKTVDLLRGKLAEEKKVKKALIVDDSLNTREIEKSILELEDFAVSTAADGIEGLEKLKQGSFDLVVTDIEMPRMDGFTMIENIRKDARHRNLPIIVVSSHQEQEYRRKIMAAGANAYIVKSDFDRNSLAASARRLT